MKVSFLTKYFTYNTFFFLKIVNTIFSSFGSEMAKNIMFMKSNITGTVIIITTMIVIITIIYFVFIINVIVIVVIIFVFDGLIANCSRQG